ncbi:MAG TPA: futalosine hydrolase [Phycisphaerales bacterium]|nr:futalosine hydrolase [Phycisphaerales bacterium]
MAGDATWRGENNVLVVVAAPAEAKAVASGLGCSPPERDREPVDAGDGWRLLRSGVGKVNAAGAVTRWLPHAGPQPIVLNLGVCGSLPHANAPPPLLSVVVASACTYADEGAITPAGFVDTAALGFPMWDGAHSANGHCPAISTDAHLRQALAGALRSELGSALRVGPIATVSTCSGTDASATDAAARTGALAEAMEGAAIAHALGPRAGVAPGFAEIRVVSNTTGDRDRQTWDLPGSLAVLTRVASLLRSA